MDESEAFDEVQKMMNMVLAKKGKTYKSLKGGEENE
jgi:hypothetical protein